MVIKKKNTYRMQIILSTILLMASNIIAQPQHQQPPPMLPDSDQILKMVDELSTELSLREDQHVNILELFKAHFNEVKASMGNQKDQSGNREEMDRLRSDFENKVKNLVNDKQKAGFDEFMKNHGPQPQQQKQKR